LHGQRQFSKLQIIFNYEKNISAFQKEEKKQARFQRAYGFCKRKKSIGQKKGEGKKKIECIFRAETQAIMILFNNIDKVLLFYSNTFFLSIFNV